MPKVLSLNVTDGGRRVQTLVADALTSLAPDFVTRQAVRADTVASWRSALEREGFYVADSFDVAWQHGLPHPSSFRTDGLLIAGRWPLQALDLTRWELPWPERLLSARVDHPRGPIELHTAHVPNASTGISLYRKGQHALGRERLMKKLETFEGIHRAVTAPSDTARILTGDLNTPHSEYPNGDGFSWEHGASGNRYRYDHVFASRELRPVACDYLHAFRLNGNHHAAILAELAWE